MSRRKFLQTTGTFLAGTVALPQALSAQSQASNPSLSAVCISNDGFLPSICQHHTEQPFLLRSTDISSIRVEQSYLSGLVATQTPAHKIIVTDRQGKEYVTSKLVFDVDCDYTIDNNSVHLDLGANTVTLRHRRSLQQHKAVKLFVASLQKESPELYKGFMQSSSAAYLCVTK